MMSERLRLIKVWIPDDGQRSSSIVEHVVDLLDGDRYLDVVRVACGEAATVDLRERRTQ